MKSTASLAELSKLHGAAPLLAYQQRWVSDDSPLKIVVKGRQTGFSFATALRAVLRCLERKRLYILLSKGERQSRLLMEKVQDHIRAIGVATEFAESNYMEGTLTKQLEVRFPNGSVIYGLPANPDTARGYTGDVALDEFAFHADADRIYTALYPTITRGFSLEVVSTPNGQQGKYYDLAKAAGLVDGQRAKGNEWSTHKVSIFDAVKQGMKVDVEQLRAGVDEETWRQEFCCEFISAASEWIPAELFQQCVSSEATTGLGNDGAAGARPPDHRTPNPEPRLYAGWDIARNRDLSVIWLSEMVGDVTWTRGVIEMRNMSTPEQMRQARTLMPLIHRMNVDQSGMGLAIAEKLAEEFPGKVEGVQFTQQTKEAMAVLAKRRMEETKVRIPDDDKIRASFRSVKKTVNAVGSARFDAEHDAKFGHADHWWAFCLAETAAEQPAYHLADVGGVVGVPVVTGMREAIL